MSVVEKRVVNYRFDEREYTHYVLYLQHNDKKILLSPINLYLKHHSSGSLKTSEKYAGTLVRFLNFLFERHKDDGENFWRSVTEKDLREWQQEQVRERDKAKKKRPGDKTISDNANFIHTVYAWLKQKNFPISMKFQSKDWKFAFKDESLLRHLRPQVLSRSTDHGSISTGDRRTQDGNKHDLVIMSQSDQIRLMSAYSDPVYAVCFLLSLGTGLREEGVSKMPYAGIGDNIHIRPYPELLSEMKGSKTFKYTVVEKGKERTLEVQIDVWRAVCEIYLPLYFERRKLLKKKHPEINPDSVFFINRLGNPVTPKKISTMTNVAKRKLDNFPWTFHHARSWYATKYMISHLSKNKIDKSFYDASVEDGLRKQIGHKDIRTTYMYYIRMASLVLASANHRIGQHTFRELQDISESAIQRFGG
ncbi:hypothetical protein [Marinobacter sp. MDS2]|uniref:hypothetical protein n=1 Tax=Marinobacter sp. MDS2 TaxID=3065961 RepID=UPI00273BB59B|nr:hypothetical protein [Marinobacter sp. MDS2]MDP4547983.1 hypothetical protein [Marinobacter sp. MDS2]